MCRFGVKQEELDDQLIGGGRKFLSVEAILYRTKRGEKKSQLISSRAARRKHFFKV